MPRADVDIFFSTNKPAFAYVDGGEAVGEASAVAADEGIGQVGVNADLTGASISGLASKPSAQEPGTSITVSSDTFHSIGIKWELEVGEDTDHNATVGVEYRKIGNSWSTATNLIRNDYQAAWPDLQSNPVIYNFAGSIMFLTPGTVYEVRLTYTDPDSSDPQDSRVVTFQTSTRAIPVKPTGNSYFVVPGGGGGDGSDLNPFRGLDAANAAATPGDTFLLRNGTYSKATINTSGSAGNHIVYERDLASPGAVIDAIELDASYVWFEGLTFTYSGPYTLTSNPPIYDAPSNQTSAIYVNFNAINSPHENVVISACSFTGYRNGVYSGFALADWTICDNTVVGIWDAGVWETGTAGGSDCTGFWIGAEGVTGGSGCVIVYNSVTRTTKAILTSNNCDIAGNDVFDVRGSSPNTDLEAENVRMFGNRCSSNAAWFQTYQAQISGPWYFCYNQYADAANTGGIWKWSSSDRVVSINNTYYTGDTNHAQNFIKWFSRNDLWVWDTGGSLWGGNPVLWLSSPNDRPSLDQWTPGWNTDVDYCGMYYGQDVGGRLGRWSSVGSYNTINIADMTELYTITGMGQNGIEVTPAIFDTFDTGTGNQTVNPTAMLTLVSGANAAVDVGDEVPNLADFYGGTAPDLGCHDRANGPLHFGPRETNLDLDQRIDYWTKH